MSFVKSILQQWRDRNLKKNPYSDSEQLIVSDIPGTDIAEQHLLEALARQINDAVNNGKMERRRIPTHCRNKKLAGTKCRALP